MNECTHETADNHRIKDIILDTDDGERTISIHINYCPECESILDVTW